MKQAEFDELQELAEKLESAFNEFDQALRNADSVMYDRWKAYGKQVSDEFVSMGPNMHEVMEKLEQDIEPDDDDDEDDESNVCGQMDCNNPELSCEECPLNKQR